MTATRTKDYRVIAVYHTRDQTCRVVVKESAEWHDYLIETWIDDVHDSAYDVFESDKTEALQLARGQKIFMESARLIWPSLT